MRPAAPAWLRPAAWGLAGLLAMAGAAPAAGQDAAPAAIDTRAVVEHLADDALEGRLTGSDGIRRAADYLIGRLEAIGAVPRPGADGFRQPFAYTAGVVDTGTTLRIDGIDPALVRSPGGVAADGAAGEAADGAPTVRALAFSDTGRAEGPLVFAGYGLTVPETDDFSYDSYATLDVEGKIVVVLRYFPEETEGALRGTLARYAGLRYKALAARERGAAGLIVVTGPRSPNAGQLVPLTFDTAVSGSGLVAATVDGPLGAAIVGSAGRPLDDVQASLDTANPHVAGFDLPLEAVIDARLARREATGHNVIGYLPPPPGAAAVAKPDLLLGAHYDHLGRGGGGDSLARAGEAGAVHNGADDNASGVAAVLAAGARLAAAPRDRGILLAFWSGEELGLLGSAAFVDQAAAPVDRIAAYLNFDMVGRLRNNALTVQAVGSSSIWTGLVEELNAAAGFDLAFVADPYLPTDVGSLNRAGVPSLNFFTGSHEDYHRPTDDAAAINYAGLDRIVDLAAAVAARLAVRPEPPDFIRVEQVQQRGGGAAMRIFTGTIPDYAQEVDGLALSGVIGGGPAEAAGLREGDVIVGLAGQTVANIYDYMYALDLLRVGQPAEVVFLRNGERMTAELIPRARE